MGSPIRKFRDRRLFAPPPDLSQLITSFIASESQGIPHALLLTFFGYSHNSFLPFSCRTVARTADITLVMLLLVCISQHVKDPPGLIAPLAETDRTTGPARPGPTARGRRPPWTPPSAPPPAPAVENKGVEPLTPCLQSRCSSLLS